MEDGLVFGLKGRTERHLSDARKQPQPAFDLLSIAGVLAKVLHRSNWRRIEPAARVAARTGPNAETPTISGGTGLSLMPSPSC